MSKMSPVAKTRPHRAAVDHTTSMSVLLITEPKIRNVCWPRRILAPWWICWRDRQTD